MSYNIRPTVAIDGRGTRVNDNCQSKTL